MRKKLIIILSCISAVILAIIVVLVMQYQKKSPQITIEQTTASSEPASTESTRPQTESQATTEPATDSTVPMDFVDGNDVDEDGVYIGPLDQYITDDTGQMLEEEKTAEAAAVRAVEEQFCSTIFNFNGETGDFTDSLLSLTHEKCQYTDEIRNIYPTFSAMEMNTQFVSMMQNTCFFFRNGDYLYARSVVSPFLKGYSKYAEDDDYVSPIVFHMVKEGDNWLILKPEFSIFSRYEDDYVAHKTPGTNGTTTTFDVHGTLFYWSFTDVEAFIYAREYYSDIEGHLDIPDDIDVYPAEGGTT